MLRRLPPTSMLQAFVYAAKEGNFARAAISLNLTASAISHQIIKLEDWWNIRLFIRHSRGVQLTEEGAKILPIVETFFAGLEGALEDIGVKKTTPLHVVSSPSFCTAWLAPRLMKKGNQGEFPEIVLQSAEINSDDIFSLDFDVAIVIGDGIYQDCHVELLMQDYVFPVLSPGILKDGMPIPVEDINKETIIRRIESGVCPSWADWCRYNGLDHGQYENGPCFPNSILTIALAARGEGVALGRTSLVYEHLLDGQLVPATGVVMPSPNSYYIICKEGRENESQICSFKEWIKQEVSDFLQDCSEKFPALTNKNSGQAI